MTGSGQHILLDRLERAFPGIFQADLMVTAFDVKHGKPNPEPYLMGMDKGSRFLGIDLQKNQSIVIENAPLGVQAGVASGVLTIAVNTGPLPDSALYDAGAHLLFHSMEELSERWGELVLSLKFKV